MKKIFILFTSFMLVLGISSCTVKDRVTGTTVRVSVSPSGESIYKGSTKQFKVTVLDENDKTVTSDKNIIWSVDGGVANGSINATGLYTAPSTISSDIDVLIIADVGGIRGTSKLRVTVIDPATRINNVYSFYGEISQDFKNQVNNPPDANGGYIYIWAASPYSMNRVKLTTVQGEGEFYEGIEALKFYVYRETISALQPVAATGVVLKFGYSVTDKYTEVPIDLSSFSAGTFNFAIKSSIDVKIDMSHTVNTNKATTKLSTQGIPLNNTWQKVSIPISSFTGSIDFSKFSGIAFSMLSGHKDDYFIIDDVYLEK